MKPLLKVQDLDVWFPKATNFWGKVTSHIKAVNGVSFELNTGETLGIIGESGSGKSTTGFSVMRALKPTHGSILFSPDGVNEIELCGKTINELRPLRKEFQLIFQDPFSSLNPRMTVFELIAEPLIVNHIGTHQEQVERVKELLVEVGLKPEFLTRYPHAFSGGQRQRIVIARALALKPKLIVCDEAVSALDVSVQAQILNLLMNLKEKYNFSYIFIGHDLEVIRHIADRVAVMYAGRLVEEGRVEDVLTHPLHPYTKALLATSPKPDPTCTYDESAILSGEVPDPSRLPNGCVFHPRCHQFIKGLCDHVVPECTIQGDRKVRCLMHENTHKNAFKTNIS